MKQRKSSKRAAGTLCAAFMAAAVLSGCSITAQINPEEDKAAVQEETQTEQTLPPTQTPSGQQKPTNTPLPPTAEPEQTPVKMEATEVPEPTKAASKEDSSDTAEGGSDQGESAAESVKAAVDLYAGNYFDNRLFGDEALETTCEIHVSNVTDTSFDFAIYETNQFTGGSEIIFMNNTAVFTGDGREAAFFGKEYTLYFTFPDHHSSYPVVTDIEVSGFAPAEGYTFVNNSIPGHEFG